MVAGRESEVCAARGVVHVMTTEQETYLGDGLYVSHDGYQVKLRAPREFGDHEVYLEPPVLAAFVEWLRTTGSTLMEKRCVSCGEPLPARSRGSRRYCSTRCNRRVYYREIAGPRADGLSSRSLMHLRSMLSLYGRALPTPEQVAQIPAEVFNDSRRRNFSRVSRREILAWLEATAFRPGRYLAQRAPLPDRRTHNG